MTIELWHATCRNWLGVWGCSSVIELLPVMRETLGSIPSTREKRGRRRGRWRGRGRHLAGDVKPQILQQLAQNVQDLDKNWEFPYFFNLDSNCEPVLENQMCPCPRWPTSGLPRPTYSKQNITKASLFSPTKTFPTHLSAFESVTVAYSHESIASACC